MPDPTVEETLAALRAELAALKLSVPAPVPPAVPLMRRFFEELAVVQAALAPYANMIRAGMLALALAVVSGSPPPFDQVSAWLGKAGWFGAGLLMILTAFVKSPTTLTQLLASSTEQEKATFHQQSRVALATSTGLGNLATGITAGVEKKLEG